MWPEFKRPDDVASGRAQYDAFALFVDDHELRRRINPKLGEDRFRAAVRNAELLGFPKKHKVWGGRYWDAC